MRRPRTGRWRAAATIFALAFLLRLAHLVQVRDIPFFDWPIGDGRAYYEWAGRIVAGDWLGSEVFYQAPLYPYFLALLRLADRDGFWTIYLVQSLLGSLACGLLVFAGARLFSRRAGLCAGIVLAAYAPAVFFDGVLQKATLDGVLMAALLLVMVRLAERPRAWGCLGAGAVLGLLGLTRENTLALLPVLAPWCAWRFPKGRRRWGGAGAALCGTAAVLLPVAFRNLAVGGSFALTTAQLGPNFYIGNHEKADGRYKALRPGRGDPQFERADAVALAEKAEGRSLTPGEVSRYWLRRAFAYIRRHPARWLALLAKKWFIAWNAWEVPDEEDYYLYCRYSSILATLGAVGNFGVLGPLAAAGVALWWKDRRRHGVLLAMVLVLTASVAAFYVFGRYRFPLVPILALYAGAALDRGAAWTRARRFRSLLPAAVFGAALLFCNAPSPVYEAPSLYNLAYVLAQRGDTSGAETAYRRDIARKPEDPYPHFNLANLLRARGALDEAAGHYGEAIRHAEEPWAAPHVNLGIVLALKGDFDRAEEQFRRALDIEPDNENARRNLARCLAEKARRAPGERPNPSYQEAPP